MSFINEGVTICTMNNTSVNINGNSKITGTLTCSSILNISGGSTFQSDVAINGVLSFGARVQDFLINLYGTSSFGFGINASTLRYNVPAANYHKF